jgi:multicomponent Na+:H+ antiporter subunit D
MIASSVPPFAIFFAGALIALLTRGWLRSIVLLLIPVVGALNLAGFEHGVFWQEPFLGYTLTLMHVDKLSLLFGYLFHLAAFISLVYALHERDAVQQISAVLYAGGALGAVFAGDLIVLFIFWEVLAVSSVFLIWARRTEKAEAAGLRYLIIQVSSGLLLMLGILVRVHESGSIAFGYIGLESLSGWLIFFAFGIKCAFPGLHSWLVDAYPEATPMGTVVLSAFTTKTAVYALARAYPGAEPLIYIGAVMTMFPIFYAVIENDLRRVLAYSMINQIGFMVCGIGIGTEMAINGAVSHAFNDVIFKGLLFMSMGAVLFRTGKINGSELGGLYKSMPFTTGLCMVGAASISAFPLFSGFVSKSMVMVAAIEQGHPIVWLALLFASAGVFHHAGIKIPYFAFFAHDSGIRTKEAPWNMLLAMVLAAAICLFNGCYPWVLYSMLPFPVHYAPFEGSHVLAQTQLLFFSALAFAWLNLSGLYPPELRSVNIDIDWIYRRACPAVIGSVVAWLTKVRQCGIVLSIRCFDRFMVVVCHYNGPQGVLARTWPIGGAAIWVLLMLAGFLIVYYV